MTESKRFLVGDLVTVKNPIEIFGRDFYPETKLKVTRVEQPEDLKPGPRCPAWNCQDLADGLPKASKTLNNECGWETIGRRCDCKEKYELCFPYQLVYLQVPEEDWIHGCPQGYALSGYYLEKTNS